jgi:hypothetical protein
MSLAYTPIGSASRLNALGALSSAKARCPPMIRPAGNGWRNMQAMRRLNQAAANGTETGMANPGNEHVHEELTSVLIGMKACIQVAIQRYRNAGREPDQSLVNAATLADLAIATIRRFGADTMNAHREKMPEKAYPA